MCGRCKPGGVSSTPSGDLPSHCRLAVRLPEFGAVLSGLVISQWKIVGTGLTEKHHLFVWPAFALMIALAVWRILTGNKASRRSLGVYLAAMVLTSVLIAAAGYWGGEMLIGS